MKFIQFSFFLFFITFSLSSQIPITVNVRGEFSVTDDSDVSFSQAKENARNDAKRKAVSEVCGQRVSVWEQVESSTKFGEIYSSSTSIEEDGEIVEFQIINEGKDLSVNNPSLTIFFCEARVKVKKIKPDPAFKAEIFGIDAHYIDGDIFSFMVEPTKDCYLNIFIYENADEISRLYPNERESLLKKLDAHVREEFPTSSDKGYAISAEKSIETIKILFFFTKKPWEPIGISRYDEKKRLNFFTREKLEKQMIEIPANQRLTVWKTFEIKKKQ